MRFEFLSPIHKATRQIAAHLEGPCAAAGVNTREAHLLSYLRSYEPCAVGDLLRVFGQRPSTMTSLLDRLDAQGLVQRVPGTEDRRRVILRLTRKGRGTADRIRECLAAFEARVRAHADPRDIQGFRAVMEAIAVATGEPAASLTKPAGVRKENRR
ncbi:MAG TPA: MarR family transcriptional regulator [Candidatus Eisenbacteria bacterium]|nr:MarR family transcriptional regulator [Candidatus Eisenbacteria bacterium]